MAQGKKLEEEVATRGQGGPEGRDLRSASRIACSLASSCANVNEFLWTNSYGRNCGERQILILAQSRFSVASQVHVR